jgi:hypothetical protein
VHQSQCACGYFFRNGSEQRDARNMRVMLFYLN